MLPVSSLDGLDGVMPTWPDIRDFAVTAESSGLDSVWLADHFFYRDDAGTVHGMHEPWTILSAVAGATTRVELGQLVLCVPFRDPGLTAKMAAALEVVAPGRTILGLGAGWHGPEFEAFGVPFDHRVGRFEEALQIIVPLLRGEAVTFEGRYHRVRGAVLAPAPERRIPILIAAGRPRMLRLTARWADAYQIAWFGRVGDRLRTRFADFAAALADEGRDPTTIAWTVGITVRDTDQPAIAEPEADAIEGSVDDIAAALGEYVELGVDHVIVGLEPMTVRSVERLGAAAARLRATPVSG